MRQKWLVLFLLVFTIIASGCTKTTIVSEPVSEVETVEKEEQASQPAEESTKVNIMPEKLATSCTDTDSGIDKTSRGTITGTWNDGTTFENEDDCLGGVYLVEYYCEDDQPRSKNFRCEVECKRGVCT